LSDGKCPSWNWSKTEMRPDVYGSKGFSAEIKKPWERFSHKFRSAIPVVFSDFYQLELGLLLFHNPQEAKVSLEKLKPVGPTRDPLEHLEFAHFPFPFNRTLHPIWTWPPNGVACPWAFHSNLCREGGRIPMANTPECCGSPAESCGYCSRPAGEKLWPRQSNKLRCSTHWFNGTAFG